MNNWIGLLIALSLALVAGVLNWKYLEGITKDVEMVSFVSIKDNVTIEAGTRFAEEHLTSLEIPKRSVGSLYDSAVLYEDRHAVVSQTALQNFQGGQVVLHQDLRTAAKKINFDPATEEVHFVPVGGAFIDSLFNPDDMVNFSIAAPRKATLRNEPPPQVKKKTTDEQWQESLNGAQVEIEQGPIEFFGPFRIVSIGGRLGSYEVNRATNRRASQAKTIGIAIKKKNGQLESKGKALIDRIMAPGFRHAGVSLVQKGK